MPTSTYAIIYNVNTRNIHAIITGSKAQEVAEGLADGEEYGICFDDYTNCGNDRLHMCSDTNEYDTDSEGFDPYKCSL